VGGGTAKCRAITTAVLTLFLSATSPAGAAPHHGLSGAQIHRIVAMTGYHGLRSHRFDVADAFHAGGTKTVVVRLDHAPLGVTRHALRRQLALAARLSAQRPHFASKLRLDSRAKQRITFHVAPANVLTPQRDYVRYLIFTRQGERLANLTRPQRIPDIQALTVIDAAHRINVTLLQDRAKGATWGPRLPAAKLFAMVESLNTSSYVFLTPKMLRRLEREHINSNLVLALGREIWSNSLGFAILAARAGTPYPSYARQAARLRFGFYRKYDLRYLTVSAAQYRSFRGFR
jgi:hypothetical protein